MNGKLRNMTAVYLLHGEDMLFLYRRGSRVVGDSYVGAAGGHFEKDELNDARACVLRELREETGLTEADVPDLTLRYVTLRLKNGEIRQNYYFFAHIDDPEKIAASNEGDLTWVPMTRARELNMPHSAWFVVDHYLREGKDTTHLYGGITEENSMAFAVLREF